MPTPKTCIYCGKQFSVPPSRIEKAKYCSHKCREDAKARPPKTCTHCGKQYSVIPVHYEASKYCSRKCKDADRTNISGKKHPRWQENAVREKTCINCGKKFTPGPTEAISTFATKKFCSNSCAVVGQLRYKGENHPRWTGGTNKRCSKHYTWANRVISRDSGVCQKCGAFDVELHAHHIEAFIDNEDARYDLSNGVTLCAPCHWNEHSTSEEYPLPDDIVIELVKNKKTSRRVIRPCAYCGKYVSRTVANFSKSKSGKIYCDVACRGLDRRKR